METEHTALLFTYTKFYWQDSKSHNVAVATKTNKIASPFNMYSISYDIHIMTQWQWWNVFREEGYSPGMTATEGQATIKEEWPAQRKSSAPKSRHQVLRERLSQRSQFIAIWTVF